MNLASLLAMDERLEFPNGFVDAAVDARLLDQAAAALAQVPAFGAGNAGSSLTLVRPRDDAQLAQVLTDCVAHVPWTSADEAEELLASKPGRYWSSGALLLCVDGSIRGALVLGPLYGRMAVAAFGLLPAHRSSPDLVAWVAQAWREAASRVEMRWAAYDQPYAAAFAEAGFMAPVSRNRIVIPLVERPVPAGYAIAHFRRKDIPGWLSSVHVGIDCTVEEISEEASVAATVDGKLAGAVIVSRGPLAHWATLEQVWMDPKLRNKGLATAVCQESMNALVRIGIRHYVAWELTTNRTVRPLNDHFGVSRAEPVRHYGRIAPLRVG